MSEIVDRSREECIRRLKQHREWKQQAVSEGEMQLARECQTVITEMLWMLGEDFVDDIEELEESTETTSSKQGDYPSHYC